MSFVRETCHEYSRGATSPVERGDNYNNYCFECLTDMPQFISVNNGIFICDFCAEFHRGLGDQISFVVSLDQDCITSNQKRMMKIGGNK